MQSAPSCIEVLEPRWAPARLIVAALPAEFGADLAPVELDVLDADPGTQTELSLDTLGFERLGTGTFQIVSPGDGFPTQIVLNQPVNLLPTLNPYFAPNLDSLVIAIATPPTYLSSGLDLGTLTIVNNGSLVSYPPVRALLLSESISGGSVLLSVNGA